MADSDGLVDIPHLKRSESLGQPLITLAGSKVASHSFTRPSLASRSVARRLTTPSRDNQSPPVHPPPSSTPAPLPCS